VIDLLKKWSNVNEIAVNKKKSGILVIDNDRNDTHQHRGYPDKLTYKYLGIKIDIQLSPKTGLEEGKKKLDIYLSRNNWINKSTHSDTEEFDKPLNILSEIEDGVWDVLFP